MNVERVESMPAATPLRWRISSLRSVARRRLPARPGITCLALAGATLGCAPDDAAEAEAEVTPTSVLFTGATVLDGSGAPSFVADVAVEGDRITFVGDAAESEAAPATRDTIALDGLLLTPGFIDMHSHITVASRRRGVRAPGG